MVLKPSQESNLSSIKNHNENIGSRIEHTKKLLKNFFTRGRCYKEIYPSLGIPNLGV